MDEGAPCPGPDFHENDQVSFSRDDVYFTTPAGKIPLKDPVALEPETPGRGEFAVGASAKVGGFSGFKPHGMGYARQGPGGASKRRGDFAKGVNGGP